MVGTTAESHSGAEGSSGTGPVPYTHDPSSVQMHVHHDMHQWLVDQRNDGKTPSDICATLVEQGWDADSAARISQQSLRSADRHRLLYITLCWSAGLGALGLGSATHLALQGNETPLATASFITLALVMIPLALWTAYVARSVEERESHAIWSPTRHVLFGTLATAVGIVGLVRMLSYTFQAVAAAVGADGYEFTPESVLQVAVTMSISIPLFAWSLREWRRSSIAIRSLSRDDDSVRGNIVAGLTGDPS